MDTHPTRQPLDLPAYTVVRRPRVKRRLHFELGASGDLLVVAPPHLGERDIHLLLGANIPRVERFLAEARRRHLPPLAYTHGEQHLYLGESCRLSVQPATKGRGKVEPGTGEIRVFCDASRPQSAEATLWRWYRERAAVVFTARLERLVRRADWVGSTEVPLQVRRMKRTWGNCSASGVIKLNAHLVKAPLKTIDSVIAHELCHLREMNHGRRFYDLLASLNPDWKADREALRQNAHRYLRT